MRAPLGVGLFVAIALTLPVSAHHSHGSYVDGFTDFEGVVQEVAYLVPHSWVYLEVKGKTGEIELWALEAASRVQLENRGVTRESVRPGDEIKVRCHVLRDGSNGCLLGFLKARDGSVVDWDGNGAPVPTDF